MGAYFEVHGYEVDCARDRTDAERLLAERVYSALITDLRLTGSDDIDGLRIASYALDNNKPSLCIILLTAYVTAEVEKSARMHGVTACLSKPSPLDEIAASVSRLLGRAA